MRYMGSKYKLKEVVELIESRHEPEGRWVEPFAGGLGSAARVVKHDSLLLNDLLPGLMNMFEQVREGLVELPDNVTEEEYNCLKQVRGVDPVSIFVSFACSWGGKEWGGYARSGADYKRQDYAKEGRTLTLKKLKALEEKDIKFSQVDYKTLVIKPGDVVYCDPPYEGTTGYKTGGFQHGEFWDWVEQVSKTNHVYVSEFTDREGWEKVWERKRAVQTAKAGNMEKTELLLYKGPKI